MRHSRPLQASGKALRPPSEPLSSSGLAPPAPRRPLHAAEQHPQTLVSDKRQMHRLGIGQDERTGLERNPEPILDRPPEVAPVVVALVTRRGLKPAHGHPAGGLPLRVEIVLPGSCNRQRRPTTAPPAAGRPHSTHRRSTACRCMACRDRTCRIGRTRPISRRPTAQEPLADRLAIEARDRHDVADG